MKNYFRNYNYVYKGTINIDINKCNNRETYSLEIVYKESIILVTICNLRLKCKVLWSKRMFLHRKCCCIVNKGWFLLASKIIFQIG